MFSNKENDKCDDKIIVIFFALVFIIYFKSKVNLRLGIHFLKRFVTRPLGFLTTTIEQF